MPSYHWHHFRNHLSGACDKRFAIFSDDVNDVSHKVAKGMRNEKKFNSMEIRIQISFSPEMENQKRIQLN